MKSNEYGILRFSDEIGELTLNELINHPTTEVIKKGNRVTLKRRTETGIYIFEYTRIASRNPDNGEPADIYKQVVEMKNDGMLQKDIALELNISESFVSHVLKKNKKPE